MNVFLDLDGTLTNPYLGATRSIAYALEKLDLPVPDLDTLGWVIGPAMVDSLAKLGVPDPELAMALYRERYADVGLLENEVYDGIPEMLQGLGAAGATLFLATAKTNIYARRITAHFGLSQYLSHQFGPELDGTRSNKGHLLEYALAETGIDPQSAVMVGDRIHDFRAARHVGMKAVAVSWGFGNPDEYKLADAICEHPQDLPDIVASL